MPRHESRRPHFRSEGDDEIGNFSGSGGQEVAEDPWHITQTVQHRYLDVGKFLLL